MTGSTIEHFLTLSRTDACFFAAVLVFVYTQLFHLPFTPIFFEGDHYITVSNAIRMLNGEVMYRDFFHFAPPGGELYYIAMYALFGQCIWVLNFTILWLTLAQVYLAVVMSKQVLKGAAVYLPALLFVVIGFRHFGIDGSYRIFSMVFVLAAAAVLMGSYSNRALIVAGSLCGLSSFFVHTRGFVAVAAICVFILWKNISEGFALPVLLKQGLLVVVPFVFVVVLTHSYFAWVAGFENYYACLVTFVSKYYAHDPLSNYSAYLSDFAGIGPYLENLSFGTALFRYARFIAPSVFVYALIPFVYVAFVIYRLAGADAREARSPDLTLLLVLGLTLFAGLSAPTGFRLYHIAIPGVILSVWLLDRSGWMKRALPGFIIGLGILGASYVVQRQMTEKHYLELPAGGTDFLSRGTREKYEWLAEHTTPGEYLYEPHHPSFYLPLHLVNPTPLFLIRDNGYTPPFQVESIVESLRRRPPTIIVWHGVWSKRAEERQLGDNLHPLWEFLQENYEWQTEFVDFAEYTPHSYRDIEMWKLKGADFSQNGTVK